MKKALLSIVISLSLMQCTSNRTASAPAPTSVAESPAAEQQAGSWKESITYYAFLDGAFVETELDRKPEYRQGELEFLKRIYSAMRYPAAARDKGIGGTVLLALTIDELGNLADSYVKEGIGYGCDEEALRAVRNASATGFEPAIKDGNPVKVRFDMPVRFRVE